jgi:hypothetical protein
LCEPYCQKALFRAAAPYLDAARRQAAVQATKALGGGGGGGILELAQREPLALREGAAQAARMG